METSAALAASDAPEVWSYLGVCLLLLLLLLVVEHMECFKANNGLHYVTLPLATGLAFAMEKAHGPAWQTFPSRLRPSRVAGVSEATPIWTLPIVSTSNAVFRASSGQSRQHIMLWTEPWQIRLQRPFLNRRVANIFRSVGSLVGGNVGFTLVLCRQKPIQSHFLGILRTC